MLGGLHRISDFHLTCEYVEAGFQTKQVWLTLLYRTRDPQR